MRHCRNVKLRLKEGEEWREAAVTVPTSSGHKVMAFDQPVGPDKGGRPQRLCCNCKRAIRDASPVDSDSTLSMLDLFCQTKCVRPPFGGSGSGFGSAAPDRLPCSFPAWLVLHTALSGLVMSHTGRVGTTHCALAHRHYS